ncbi:MAG: ArsR/SmtB family transcription factor [Fibrobacterota bacterium]
MKTVKDVILKDACLRRFEKRSAVLRAMAHPTRLFILEQLAGGSLCVCQIHGMIAADMSTVSKHLSVLKNAGLVSSRKEGLQVHYSLEKPCVLDFFSCFEE